MSAGAQLGPLVSYGFLLGWSVAWPPGPINAEIIRRGLARGFAPAIAVAFGASSGDALWAILVALGAGLALAAPGARLALELLSTALLLLLAGAFLRGAWRSWREGRMAAASAFDRPRAGYLVGLGMALTSPWNMAFWLAVIGRPETALHGLAASLVIALSVILGAISWCLLLAGAVVRLRWRFQSRLWEVVARAATGLVMLGFGLAGIWRFAGA